MKFEVPVLPNRDQIAGFDEPFDLSRALDEREIMILCHPEMVVYRPGRAPEALGMKGWRGEDAHQEEEGPATPGEGSTMEGKP